MSNRIYSPPGSSMVFEEEYISIDDVASGKKTSPFDIDVFSNLMGINLACVGGFTVTRQAHDGQIVKIVIDSFPFNDNTDGEKFNGVYTLKDNIESANRRRAVQTVRTSLEVLGNNDEPVTIPTKDYEKVSNVSHVDSKTSSRDNDSSSYSSDSSGSSNSSD